MLTLSCRVSLIKLQRIRMMILIEFWNAGGICNEPKIDIISHFTIINYNINLYNNIYGGTLILYLYKNNSHFFFARACVSISLTLLYMVSSCLTLGIPLFVFLHPADLHYTTYLQLSYRDQCFPQIFSQHVLQPFRFFSFPHLPYHQYLNSYKIEIFLIISNTPLILEKYILQKYLKGRYKNYTKKISKRYGFSQIYLYNYS